MLGAMGFADRHPAPLRRIEADRLQLKSYPGDAPLAVGQAAIGALIYLMFASILGRSVRSFCDSGAADMIALAFIAFAIGLACAYKTNLLAFCAVALAFTVSSALLSLGIDLGVGAALAAFIAAIVMQVGYAAGVGIRALFLAGRVDKRERDLVEAAVSPRD